MDSNKDIKNSSIRPFSGLFVAVSILLMLLPFINTFNSFLTDLLLRWGAYKFLQNLVVPYESLVVARLFNLFGFAASGVDRGVWVNGVFLEITWNCLGWQSVVLLFASLLGGFQKSFTWFSKTQVVLIGLLGTYVVNILRLFTVGGLAVSFGRTSAIFFHDYLALLFLIVWFVFFWWFSYSYVLEERG